MAEGTRLGPRALAKSIAAAVALWLVRPLRDAVRTARRRHPVRVFTYHRVMDGCVDTLTIAPADFSRQLAYLRLTHDVVPLADALKLITSRARLRRPAATITFDDGYRSIAEWARPIMDAMGVTGTAFVCTDYVGTDKRFEHDAEHPARDRFALLGWDELAALREAGWTIGGHTASHARLSACDRARLTRELDASGTVLRARQEVHDAGYTSCFSNYGGENLPGADPFWLRRIDLGAAFTPLIWKTRAHGIELSRWRDAWRSR